METTLPLIGEEEARRRRYLTREALGRMHLEPRRGPVGVSADGQVEYFDPTDVREASPNAWYAPAKKEIAKPKKNPDGTLPRLGLRRAAAMHCFTEQALREAYYEPTGEPVALFVRKDGTELPLYDRDTCTRLPLPCTRCGAPERYHAKLCRACYSAEMATRRVAGDARRNAYYGFAPESVLYFDLELTGVYAHDEILSVSIVDGRGEVVFDSLVRPVRMKKWKRTEAIHGITPDMVKDAPTLAELAPTLRALIKGAARMIAYGTNTDFSHLSRIFESPAEREAFRAKLRDAAAEFSHYIEEYEVTLPQRSLSNAMAHFGLSWNGTAHTALADAVACRAVFERLYPHYYEERNLPDGRSVRT